MCKQCVVNTGVILCVRSHLATVGVEHDLFLAPRLFLGWSMLGEVTPCLITAGDSASRCENEQTTRRGRHASETQNE